MEENKSTESKKIGGLIPKINITKDLKKMKGVSGTTQQHLKGLGKAGEHQNFAEFSTTMGGITLASLDPDANHDGVVDSQDRAIFDMLKAADIDNSGMISGGEVVHVVREYVSQAKEQKRKKFLLILCGLFLIVQSIVFAIVVVGSAVGFLDADKSKTDDGKTALADMDGQIVGTRSEKVALPLFVAPVLGEERLASVEFVSVLMPDFETREVARHVERTTYAVVLNKTAMYFALASGARLNIWNGKAWVVTTENMIHGVCISKLECAALVVDSSSEADKFYNEAERALKDAGFLAEDESIRQLKAADDSCDFAFDGKCDDNTMCAPGTDKSDCCDKVEVATVDATCENEYVLESERVSTFRDAEVDTFWAFAEAAYLAWHEGFLTRQIGLKINAGNLVDKNMVVYDGKTAGRALTFWIEATPSNGLASDSIVVAPRGSKTIKAWVQLLIVGNSPFKHEDPRCAPSQDYPKGCQVQTGFKMFAEGVIQGIIENVESLRQTYPDAQIIVSGHSAGGAAALLVAAMLNIHGETASPPFHVERVMTFGQPAVGNAPFARLFPDTSVLRVENKADPSPFFMGLTVFPANGYRHFGQEAFFDDPKLEETNKLRTDDDGRITVRSSDGLPAKLSDYARVRVCKDSTSTCCAAAKDNFFQLNPPALLNFLKSTISENAMPATAHLWYMGHSPNWYFTLYLNTCDNTCSQNGYGGGRLIKDCKIWGNPSCNQCNGHCIKHLDDTMWTTQAICLFHRKPPVCCCDKVSQSMA